MDDVEVVVVWDVVDGEDTATTELVSDTLLEEMGTSDSPENEELELGIDILVLLLVVVEGEETTTWLVSDTLLEEMGTSDSCANEELELEDSVLVVLELLLVVVVEDVAEETLANVEANEAVAEGVAMEPAK